MNTKIIGIATLAITTTQFVESSIEYEVDHLHTHFKSAFPVHDPFNRVNAYNIISYNQFATATTIANFATLVTV